MEAPDLDLPVDAGARWGAAASSRNFGGRETLAGARTGTEVGSDRCRWPTGWHGARARRDPSAQGAHDIVPRDGVCASTGESHACSPLWFELWFHAYIHAYMRMAEV